jgi:hypothetical protein
MEEFVASFAKYLMDMTDSAFNDHCQALIALKLKPADNMQNDASAHWSYIQGALNGEEAFLFLKGASSLFHTLTIAGSLDSGDVRLQQSPSGGNRARERDKGRGH